MRALQTYRNSPARLAAADYSTTSLTYDINIFDGNTHQVSFYALDQDDRGRSQTITISDASSGTVLASNDISNFSGGDYVVYDIAGNVNVTMSNDGGSLNAVNSAIFFDPGPGGSGTVTQNQGIGSLVAIDATTQGNWTGVYGADGYSVMGGTTSLPAYATFSVSNDRFWQNEAPGTSDPTAIQVAPGDSQRVQASDYSATSETFNVNLTDGQTHQVALYVQDENNYGRTQTVTVTDATSGTVLSTTNVSNFANGEYLVYDLSGNVKITLTNGSGSLNAVASGLFFDPGPGGTLSGTVFGDLNMDQTREADEPTFAGLTVTVTDPNSNTVATATTDSAGNYSIGGLPLNEQLMIAAASSEGWIALQGQATFTSAGSQELSVPELRLLPPPTNLTATAPGSSEVDLSWASNSAGLEQGFHVYESVDGALFGTTPIVTVGSGATSTSITGLSASHDYAFVVAAYDASGDSALSNIADAAAPGTPTGLVVESFNQNGHAYATLTWNPSDPLPAGTTYQVFVSETPNSFTGSPVASGLTATTYTYGPYDPSLTLYFEVRAVVPLPAPATVAAGSGTLMTPPILPPQAHSVVYYEGFNVGLIFVSPNPLDGAYVQQQLSVPAFDSSFGALQTTSLTVKDASAGMVWAPYAMYPYFAWAYADGYVNVGTDGVPNVSDISGGPDPYWNTRVDDGTFSFAGPPPRIQAVAEVGYCAGGPIVTVCMAELVGFVQVKYTYT